MLLRNLTKDKFKEKQLTMTNNTTHSTAIMGVTDYHNKMDTLGKGKHTYKDLT